MGQLEINHRSFMIPISSSLRPVLDALSKIGRPRFVGGCVRDAFLGRESEDLDMEVAGTSFDTLARTLGRFGATDVVGRSFGTIKLSRDGTDFDFSLPRRESKTGSGHRGFKVAPDPTLDAADAASRRDFTINAMAWDPLEQQLIDPFNGKSDLAAKILRHTSPAFVEDPLRVLRAMQFASRFELNLAEETITLCRSISHTFNELAKERIWAEWDKWALHSRKPSLGLQVLRQTDWLRHFPEIAALVDTPQDPLWHPEGDVFIHTQHCLDALVNDSNWANLTTDSRRSVMFGVLAHDFGKPSTTIQKERNGTLRWASPGHSEAGCPISESWLERIGAPSRFAPIVAALVRHHMAHHGTGDRRPSDPHLRRLARKLAPATITELVAVMRADARGRPPRIDEAVHHLIDFVENRARELALQDSAPRPLVLGRHLIERGLAPGPQFKQILTTAFEAQLDGAFVDHGGSMVWIDSHLKLTEN
jgi:tRNA nucleotidyltransferase (CCA-adding enzyme)